MKPQVWIVDGPHHGEWQNATIDVPAEHSLHILQWYEKKCGHDLVKFTLLDRQEHRYVWRLMDGDLIHMADDRQRFIRLLMNQLWRDLSMVPT